MRNNDKKRNEGRCKNKKLNDKAKGDKKRKKLN